MVTFTKKKVKKKRKEETITPKKSEIGTSRKKLKLYKESLYSLSLIEKEVAIGCLLGDASIQTQDGGKTYRLKFLQGEIHKEYLSYCMKIFSRWILSDLSPQHRVSKKDGKENKAWRTQTISHKAFKPLADLFLDKNGKKVITPNLIGEHLTWRGFAFWLMDDGGRYNYNKNKSYKGITINTQGFTFIEVNCFLVNPLIRKFNILCWPGKNKNRWVIRISAKSFKTIALGVGPYFHPSMLYKFPLSFKTE